MPRTLPNDWFDGFIPDNVELAESAYLDSTQCFELYRSEAPDGMRIGEGVGIYLPTMFDVGPRGRMRIADFAMLNGPRIVCDELIEIGSHCLISWNVVLMDSYRLPEAVLARRDELRRLAGRMPKERRADFSGRTAPIRIGSNVWLGFDAIVLPGVTIGNGSVIGARSVVSADVPPYSIAVGNPARVVRTFPPEARDMAVLECARQDH